MGNRIKGIMAIIFKIPVEEITDETSPDNTESWDSLKHMNLITALEEEFDVQFEDEEIMEMMNIIIIKKILSKKRA